MSEKQVFVMAHPSARRNAANAVMACPEKFIVEIKPPTKTRDQEALYHSIFGEVAKQVPFMGAMRDSETWKRLLVDSFARVKAAEGDPVQGVGSIIPNLDGTGFVQLGVQTRRFSKRHASEFIEFLLAWTTEKGVALKEAPLRGYEDFQQ